MTYTEIGLLSVIAVVICDMYIFRTRLIRRRIFWASYAIIIFFQLVTNGILTGFRIVRYDADAIIGGSTPTKHAPAFIGDGRLVFAPIEDLLFGFSLVLLTLILWVWHGKNGLQRQPVSGPPVAKVAKLLRSK
jgi:hypothetical protein